MSDQADHILSVGHPSSRRLTEVAALFLRLGVTAFGGPAAHIAIPTIVIGLVASVLLFRFKVNSMWLIAGGWQQAC